MWPKVLAQLIELLPHAARLLPMADRFFQAKSHGDAETLKAVEGLRADVGQTTAAHAGLYRQMNEQSERIAAVTAEVQALRGSVNGIETRLDRSERQARKLMALTAGVFVFVVLISIELMLRR